MMDSAMGAQRMGHRMDGPQAGIRKRHPGHGARNDHVLCGRHIIIVGNGLAKVFGDQFDRVQGKARGDLLRDQRNMRFDRVREGIHPGGGAYFSGQRYQEIGVQDCRRTADMGGGDHKFKGSFLRQMCLTVRIYGAYLERKSSFFRVLFC